MPRPRKSEEPALKPVKVQGIEIPLYRLGDGRTAFADTFGGPRKVRKFTDEGEAREEAKKLAMQVLRGEALRTDMERGDIESYRRAMEILRPTGIPLTVALADFVEAWNLSKGRPLLDVVRNGLDGLDRPNKTVMEVYETFISTKRLKGLSTSYTDKLGEDLLVFVKEYQSRQIASLTSEDIQTWLVGRKVKKTGKPISMRRRNNLRGNLVTLFKYAQDKKWLPSGKVAPQEIEKGKEKTSAVSYYTPEEMRFWIGHVREEFFPWLVIGGFSGVRSEEICPPPESLKDRLRWEDFKWKKALIDLRPEVSKTNKRRLVPISDNLMLLLKDFQGLRGPVIPEGMRTDRESARLSRMSKRLTLKAEKLPGEYTHPCPGLVWRHNALRHSFCSYRVALVKSVPQVSMEAGNSISMINKHYLEAQEEEAAQTWFAIANGDVNNVIQMKFGGV